jgi:hypothetical protein
MQTTKFCVLLFNGLHLNDGSREVRDDEGIVVPNRHCDYTRGACAPQNDVTKAMTETTKSDIAPERLNSSPR